MFYERVEFTLDDISENMTPSQFELFKEFSIISTENAFWTFMAIQSVIFKAGNSCIIQTQIENFSQDWCNLFGRYYNQNYVNNLKVNLSNYFDVYLSYLNSVITEQNETTTSLLNQWKQMANTIAKNFADVNPYWKEPEWRGIINNQIDVLDKEIINNVQGIYTTLQQSYGIYHRVQTDMAEYIATGLIKQFLL